VLLPELLTSQARAIPGFEFISGACAQVTPEQMVAYARAAHEVVPHLQRALITLSGRWYLQESQRAGLQCVYVSNGNVHPRGVRVHPPLLVGYKID